MAKKKVKKTKKASKKTSASAIVKKTVSVQKQYKGGFYSNPPQIPSNFANKVLELEKEIGRPVVLLWHRRRDINDGFRELNNNNYHVFASMIQKLKEGEKVAVLVDSPGGLAWPAFKLASLLKKHCGGYNIIVPLAAKSAATLFALGADKIIMGRFAELGPLDVQVYDAEKEDTFSALEVVQAIERLNSESMQAVDQQMFHYVSRSQKKVHVLLPIVMHFVAELMKPLFDKIDTVYYTGMARLLKVAQDYAERLLQKSGYNVKDSKDIADKLTNAYSEHGFVIDYDELKRIGMKNVVESDGKVRNIVEKLAFMGAGCTILGPLEEI